jgi:large subunit ribosomal protein L24
MHIKTNDSVVVISGNDKAEKGKIETHKVLAINRAAGKITVEGVNRVYKHVRRSQKNPQGGRLNKEMPIQISNVLLYCGKCNKGVRTGSRIAKSGAKERFCKKCGGSLGEISPPPKKKVS